MASNAAQIWGLCLPNEYKSASFIIIIIIIIIGGVGLSP
jgi:hypothetical protein